MKTSIWIIFLIVVIFVVVVVIFLVANNAKSNRLAGLHNTIYNGTLSGNISISGLCGTTTIGNGSGCAFTNYASIKLIAHSNIGRVEYINVSKTGSFSSTLQSGIYTINTTFKGYSQGCQTIYLIKNETQQTASNTCGSVSISNSIVVSPNNNTRIVISIYAGAI